VKSDDIKSKILEGVGASEEQLLTEVARTLQNSTAGELYIGMGAAESIARENGKELIYDTSHGAASGFGYRRVFNGDKVAFEAEDDLNFHLIKRVGRELKAASIGSTGNVRPAYKGSLPNLYDPVDAFGVSAEKRRRLLERIDDYVRSCDTRVRETRITLTGSVQNVCIVRPDRIVYDNRPLVQLKVNVLMEENNKSEWGFWGFGGRHNYDLFFNEKKFRNVADQAIRRADEKLSAGSCPSGEMTVVLGPGWPGILLHEAIGHGLEGDFHRRGTSVYSGRLGEKLSHDDVTVVDQGNIPYRRGSLTVDDEGNPTQETVLFENGVLVGLLHDEISALHFDDDPTGNGRRQSYAHTPMPRMTNTFMKPGPRDPKEIIEAVKYGIYAKEFSGGQVSIEDGEFTFMADVAYLIEGGKITRPVKGAMLIGKGHEVLREIDMVGNDTELDPGIGTCGKADQTVVVGVGLPTIRILKLTVGGTGAVGKS